MKKCIILLATLSVCVTGCRFVKVDTRLLEDRLVARGGHDIENDNKNENMSMFGNKETETKVIEGCDFKGILAEGAYDIDYWAKEPMVTVSAPAKVMEHLDVHTEGDILVIRTDGTRINWRGVKVVACSPELKSLDVRGAVDFSSRGEISTDAFSLVVNGAGDVEIRGLKSAAVSLVVNGAGDIEVDGLESDCLDVVINGAGDIKVAGSSNSAAVSLHGAGDIDLRHLVCSDVRTDKSGIGSIRR